MLNNKAGWKILPDRKKEYRVKASFWFKEYLAAWMISVSTVSQVQLTCTSQHSALFLPVAFNMLIPLLPFFPYDPKLQLPSQGASSVWGCLTVLLSVNVVNSECWICMTECLYWLWSVYEPYVLLPDWTHPGAVVVVVIVYSSFHAFGRTPFVGRLSSYGVWTTAKSHLKPKKIFPLS